MKNKARIACIMGHRYGRAVAVALSKSEEFQSGTIEIAHAYVLHPSEIAVTSGYSNPTECLKRSSIPYSFFVDINHDSIADSLGRLSLDFVFVCGLRKLIASKILHSSRSDLRISKRRSPETQFIAFHPSDLPHGAGLSPIPWAILSEDTELIVSAFLLGDYPIDGGPILLKDRTPFPAHGDASLADQIVGESVARLVTRLLPQIVEDRLRPVPQVVQDRTYRRQLNSLDRWIDFGRASSDILKQIRAFAPPYGGCFADLDGRIVNITRAEPARSSAPMASNRAFWQERDHLIVICADRHIVLTQWQWASPAINVSEILPELQRSRREVL